MSLLKDLVVTDWTRYGNILIVEAHDLVQNKSCLVVYKGLTFDTLLNLGRLPKANLLQIVDNTTSSWIALRALCKKAEPKTCPCCKKSSGSKLNNYFKVSGYLWNKYSVVHTKPTHMMCLACLEIKAGRKLATDDFTNTLLNKINSYYQHLVEEELLRDADAV